MAKTVVLATVGSYGDLHPYMAVALALKARGLRPVIASTDVYRDKVEAEGIEFHPVRPSYDQVAHDTGLTLAEFIATVLRSPVEYLVETITLPYLSQAFADLKPVSEGADLVVVSSFSLAATMVAESFGKPLINAPLSPIVMMSDVDPPVLDVLPSLPLLRRLFGPGFVRWIISLGRRRLSDMSDRINAVRARLGLPATQGHALMDHQAQADEVVALYSPLMGAPPSRPAKPTIVAGFTAFDRDGQTELSPRLEAFLAAGDPPLVFTLGSIAVLDGERFYNEAAAAARLLGRRALLLVGREGEAALSKRLSGPDILIAGSLAFGRVSAGRLASELASLLADPRVRSQAQTVARELAGEDGAEVLADRVMARLSA